MPVLLVLCDMQGEDRHAERLAQAVAAYGEPLALSDAGYLLHTTRSSNEVFEGLRDQLGSESRESLLVLAVPQPYNGRAPAKVRLWLELLKERQSAGSSTKSRRR